MVSKVKVGSLLFPRRAATPTVSSKGRGRSLADLVEDRESSNPELPRATGVSSAALRAGEYIQSMRKAAGLSQAALAQLMNVTQARISELEAGVGAQGPTWGVMERVSRVCGAHLYFEIPRNSESEQTTYATQVYAALTACGVTGPTLQLAEMGGQQCVIVNIPQGDSEMSVILRPIAVSR